MNVQGETVTTIKTHSWRPEDQLEVRQLIAAGWRLIEVVADENPSCHASTIKGSPTIYFKLEKIS